MKLQLHISLSLCFYKRKIQLYQQMTYLLLPSSRLALYLAEQKQAKILPVKAEEYLLFTHQGSPLITTTYYKTLNIYNQEHLAKVKNINQLNALNTVHFNKKLQGLASNNNLFYVSDKFGDVYSISTKGEQKYLNSNLGIPTFLNFIKGTKRNYLIVGDEDTRIKIYNQARMHQIISFWFITRRVPLLFVQPKSDSLVLLVKKQNQINLQMQENIDQFVELYQLNVNQLEDEQFGGKLFYVSKEIEQKEECKYQTITYSQSGDLYLLKLFTNSLQIIVFKQVEGIYKESQNKKITLNKGDWDYLHGTHNSKKLIVVYGKTTVLQQTFELTLQQNQVETKQDHQYGWFNEYEHFIALQI